MRFDNIKLINTPVVSLGKFKRAGVIGCRSQRECSSGIFDIVKIVTEIHIVQFHAETPRPAKLFIQAYQLGTISRIGKVCSLGRNTKAPDSAFMDCRVRRGINFVDPPVVSCARHKAVRIGKSGKADNKIRSGLITLECTFGSSIYIVEIFAQIHIVRDRKTSRLPGNVQPGILIQCTISRSGAKSVRPDLTHKSTQLGFCQCIIENPNLVNCSAKEVSIAARTIVIMKYYVLICRTYSNVISVAVNLSAGSSTY